MKLEPREKIIRDFAEWTAFSATRSNCPVKKREEVYPLIGKPDYDEILLGGPISPSGFDNWHRTSTEEVCRTCKEQTGKDLPVGWAAKLINVYLKTRVYIGGEGCSGLVECIHPPIDRGLWRGIEGEFGGDGEILEKTHTVSAIKQIVSYDIYQTIIDGCRLAAGKLGCRLIEVEQLWEGTGP